MHIYQTGIIGEAVRTKLDSTKSAIMSGTKVQTQSFGDLIKSMMIDTSAETKAVGVTNVSSDSTSPVAKADGRTLLYALANADDDTTASAVVGALGLPISDNNVKAAADGLSAAVKLLGESDGADKETMTKLLSDFVDKYNTLMTDLSTQTTASGIMYSRLFRTAANSASDALSSAGITVGDNGQLTFDATKTRDVGISGFLGSVATAADAVSTYASSITGSQNSSLLDFLGNDSDQTSTSSYYSSLINTMM